MRTRLSKKDYVAITFAVAVCVALFVFWNDMREGLRLAISIAAIVTLVVCKWRLPALRVLTWSLFSIVFSITFLELASTPIFNYDKELSHIDEYYDSHKDLSALAPQDELDPHRVATYPLEQTLYGPSGGNIAGFNDVRGYANPIPYRIWQFEMKHLLVDKFYDLMNVKYLAVDDSEKDKAEKNFGPPSQVIEKVFRGSYEQNNRLRINIFENKDRPGHAWLTTGFVYANSEKEIFEKLSELDPFKTTVIDSSTLSEGTTSRLEVVTSTDDVTGSEIILEEYSANNMRYLVKTPTPAIFVVSELFFPGWHVRINGVNQPLFAANFILRGMVVPEGENTVEIYYFPTSLTAALILLSSVVILLGTTFTYRASRSTKARKGHA